MSVMISSVLKNECMLVWTCFCDFIVDLLKVKKKKIDEIQIKNSQSPEQFLKLRVLLNAV